MTERIYYNDSYMVSFLSVGGKQGLVLDRTCFYPTSGGQPHDTGSIQGVAVTDVYEEGDAIVHVLAKPVTGWKVLGRIDWERRFDHMQQHTGQHILSQAFLEQLGANTVSFHLGERLSTIDLDRQLSAELARHVEDRANEIVMENRPVVIRFVAREDVAALGLRKPPTVEGEVRIVDISGFDRSACGGTHVNATGEVGLIKIRRWERRGKETRVEFLCGWRALRDYRWKNETILSLANEFSVAEREILEAVHRQINEIKSLRRESNRLRDQVLDYEALALLAEAKDCGDVRVVVHAFEDRDPEDIRRIALRMIEGDRRVALLGLGAPKGRLVFARSADLSVDMGMLLKRVCAVVGGGGGGRPHFVQGGGLPGERVREALDLALRELRATFLQEAGSSGL